MSRDTGEPTPLSAVTRTVIVPDVVGVPTTVTTPGVLVSNETPVGSDAPSRTDVVSVGVGYPVTVNVASEKGYPTTVAADAGAAITGAAWTVQAQLAVAVPYGFVALIVAVPDASEVLVGRVGVPVIASGGVGTLEHLVDGIVEGHADAVLAASIFHFREFSVADAKAALAAAGVTVRPV